MPSVFLANFEFEQDLAGAGGLTAAARRVADDLSAAWLTVAQSGDVILTSPGGPEGAVDGVRFVPIPRAGQGLEYTLVPWGWTRSAVELAGRHGWQGPAPDLAAVRQVNQRSYRLSLERRLGVALEGSAEIGSVEAARQAVARLPGPDPRWVLKGGLGMSGRCQWRGRGGLTDEAAQWLCGQLSQSGPLVLEPWLDGVEEAGLLLEVPPRGVPELVGIVPLRVDEKGQYLGSRFGAEADRAGWEAAVAVAREVAAGVQQAGYFGPLGIDAMRYRAAGRVVLRPLQDLNARWTMGRLALGLTKRLPPGWCGGWVHRPRRVEGALTDVPAGVVVTRLAVPGRADRGGTGREIVTVCAPDVAARDAALAALEPQPSSPSRMRQ